ncbi:MAG TPA: DUF2079 domain-containing protein [Gaiellaceae bacterium]|nr:DUF2079 domain-containing protein [Gaiellaceae bacterium]
MDKAEPSPHPHARAAVASLAAHVRLAVYSGTALYGLLFVAGATAVYLSYQGSRLDLGNVTQAVWSTAHGRFLRVSTPAGHELVRLGSHVDPFLVLLVPLWWIWPSPLMLLVVQVVAVSAGALPVYWLGRKHLHSEAAAAGFALVYLLAPATQYTALTNSGPHAVSFATPLILFAIWFLDNDRLVPFAIVAAVAATTKEEIPIAIGCLGIWYALARGRRRAGATIFALGLAVTLVNFLVVIPHFSPSGANVFAGRYAAVGGTPGGMVRTLVTHPGAYVDAIASWHKLKYLGFLFLPFVGLWLLEPLLVLGAVPDLVVNLLSSKPEQTSIVYQYGAGIVPFLTAAAILGAARYGRSPGRLAAVALATAAVLVYFQTPLRRSIRDLPETRGTNAVHAAKAHALGLIPAGVPVSATNKLAGYLSTRRIVYVFPHVGRAEWMILEHDDPTYGTQAADTVALAKIESSPHWLSVYSAEGVEVLRKRPPGG